MKFNERRRTLDVRRSEVNERNEADGAFSTVWEGGEICTDGAQRSGMSPRPVAILWYTNFYRMMPQGFMILNSTGTIRQLVDADFERQLQRIEEAAQDLVENKCDAIIIGGSPLFTKLGYGSDIEMEKKLTARFGVPTSPGITGEIAALRSLNLKKLVVATPHEDSLNDRMKAFLEASGFNVLKIQGYGVRKNADLTDMDIHAAYRIAKKLYEQASDADGIFVPCPRWPTITDVDLLEREIGKPVVTSCQAYIWHALKMAKVKEGIEGFGRLMASLAG